jgi:hypothetical protein
MAKDGRQEFWKYLVKKAQKVSKNLIESAITVSVVRKQYKEQAEGVQRS